MFLTSCFREHYVAPLGQFSPHAVNTSEVLCNTQNCECFGPSVHLDNIQRVCYRSCVWRRTRFPRVRTLRTPARCLRIPPRLHVAVPGPRLASIKSLHYGKWRLIAWHFSSVVTEMSELPSVWCVCALAGGIAVYHSVIPLHLPRWVIGESDGILALREASLRTTVCVRICIRTVYRRIYIHNPCVFISHACLVSSVGNRCCAMLDITMVAG